MWGPGSLLNTKVEVEILVTLSVQRDFRPPFCSSFEPPGPRGYNIFDLVLIDRGALAVLPIFLLLFSGHCDVSTNLGIFCF